MDSISIRVENQAQKTVLVRWLERMFHLAEFYALETNQYPHAVYISDELVNSCNMDDCKVSCCMNHQMVDFDTGIDLLRKFRIDKISQTTFHK